MEATIQIMRKLLFASELDAYKIPRLMADDLLSGMSLDDCAQTPYKYTLEMFYYTKLELIPKDDPHWCSISIVSTDDLFVKELSIEKNKEINKKMKECIKSSVLSEEENKKLNEEIIK